MTAKASRSKSATEDVQGEKPRQTGVSTKVFDLGEFKDAHPAIFHCIDVMAQEAKGRRVFGVQRYDDPISFFDVAPVKPFFDAGKDKFGADIAAYFGPDGLADARAHKPNMTIRIIDNQYFYSFKRKFFDAPSEILKTLDETTALEALVGWAQSHAPEFFSVYVKNGGRDHIDPEEFIAQSVRLAMKKRQEHREQLAPDTANISLYTDDDGNEYEMISLDAYPLSMEQIDEEAKSANFSRTADLRMWGREIEHMITKAVRLIKSSIITKDVEANTALQSEIDRVREDMLRYGYEVKKAERKGFIKGMFSRKAAPKPEIKLNANEFLLQTLDNFETLSDAVFKDQKRCLRMVGNVESFIQPYEEYGDILRYYTQLLFGEYKKRAAQKTGLDGTADESKTQVLQNIKERREQLQTSQEVHQGVSLGIQNFMTCKNSQYEALELFREKVEGDIAKLIEAAMVQVRVQGKEAEAEIVLEALSSASDILSELQTIVEIGNEYDRALLEGRTHEIKPLLGGEDHGIKLLAAPEKQADAGEMSAHSVNPAPAP